MLLVNEFLKPDYYFRLLPHTAHSEILPLYNIDIDVFLQRGSQNKDKVTKSTSQEEY